MTTTTTTFDGQTYTIDGDAFFSNRPFAGWWGDADEGQGYTSEWYQPTIDEDGNNVTLVYHFDALRGEEPEDDGWDWANDNNIVDVK